MLRVTLLVLAAAMSVVVSSQRAGDAREVNPEGCGRSSTVRDDPSIDPSKIVGGVPAEPHSWPWQISMLYNGNHRCGGSVINSEWILSAAHCTVGLATSTFSIRLGAHNRTSGGQVVKVAAIINHADYSSSTYANDIALLKLAEPITYTKEISPVCLIDRTTETADIAGQTAVVTGWGALYSGGPAPSVLHQVGVKVDTDADCTKAYGNGHQPSNMICASLPGKDSCQGDSGGPLVLNRGDNTYDLIGIVSWGYGCAFDGFPGVYAKVASLRDWVEENIKN